MQTMEMEKKKAEKVPAEIYSDRRIEPNELIGVTIKKIVTTDYGIIIFYGERGE